ncbi:MAG: thiamine phosphate synthase [Alphaproteobacteria bacterium]|nr:thiamine phosphate synthase [Alphaproteobacteria bacterium]
MSHRPPLPAGLYGIADASFGDPVALGVALAAAGVGVVQLRCKGWPTDDRRRAARALRAQLEGHACLLVVNDDVDAAVAAGAHGVHLGQDDGDLAAARRRLGPDALIGRSTHDLAQVAAAVAEGADYLGFGPVFGTTTKADAVDVVGTDALRAAVAAAGAVPVVAIGGLTEARLPAVRATGAHGWALISALLAPAAAGPDALAAAVSRMSRTPR